MRNRLRQVLALVASLVSVPIFLGEARAEPHTVLRHRTEAVASRQFAALPRVAEPSFGGTPEVSREANGPSSSPSFSGLPVAFIENRGQLDGDAGFYLSSGGQTLQITPRGLIFDFFRVANAPDRITAAPTGDLNRLRPMPWDVESA